MLPLLQLLYCCAASFRVTKHRDEMLCVVKEQYCTPPKDFKKNQSTATEQRYIVQENSASQQMRICGEVDYRVGLRIQRSSVRSRPDSLNRIGSHFGTDGCYFWDVQCELATVDACMV